MSTNYERNAHFQGSAQQVAYKVLDLIPNSLHTYSHDDQKLVAEIIAQYAYDLVRHAIYSNHINSSYWPGSPNFGQASPMYEHDTTARTNDVPDLTAWPILHESTQQYRPCGEVWYIIGACSRIMFIHRGCLNMIRLHAPMMY